jgi:hypothetical protein
MATVLAILQAFAAIPKVMNIIDEIIVRYIATMEEKRRKRIQDANIELAHAKTQAEKDAALIARFKSGGN